MSLSVKVKKRYNDLTLRYEYRADMFDRLGLVVCWSRWTSSRQSAIKSLAKEYAKATEGIL
jgi:hypothetical protein